MAKQRFNFMRSVCEIADRLGPEEDIEITKHDWGITIRHDFEHDHHVQHGISARDVREKGVVQIAFECGMREWEYLRSVGLTQQPRPVRPDATGE